MLGIAVITCNRDRQLSDTLLALERHTTTPCRLVVADDGSTDFTTGFCREQRIPCITGANRGVAWNKNRALFALISVLRCSVAILIEDDTVPTADGWDRDWIDAARRWGHVNLAGDWFPAGHIASGAGTPGDPILSTHVSGQVEAFTREAIMYGGYLDPRFRGFGHGHVEHTRRLIRAGYGGIDGPQPLYRLIRSPITVNHASSASNPADLARNATLIAELLEDHSPRLPWRDEAEMALFRAEIAAARL